MALLAICVAAVAVVAALLRATNPEEFPDRLAKLKLDSTTIENVSPYNESHYWSPSGHLGLLYRLNEARVPYFKAQLEPLYAKLQRQPLVLDIGCGGGIATNELAKQLPEYSFTGMDAQVAALEYAARASANMSLQNTIYLKGNALQLPFEDGSFDAIVCSDVLEHITDLRVAFKEMARVLRPGGILTMDTIHRTTYSRILSIEIAENILGLLQKNSHDWRMFITPSELKEVVEASGFHTNVDEYQEMAPTPRMIVELLLMSLNLLRVEEARGSYFIGGWPMMNYVATARKHLTSE